MACIKTAVAVDSPRYLLAEYFSYHDPKARGDNITVSKRTGPICVYLEKSMKVRVGDREDCKSYFNMGQGNCQKSCRTKAKCPKMP
jgi:hypothetical protein